MSLSKNGEKPDLPKRRYGQHVLFHFNYLKLVREIFFVNKDLIAEVITRRHVIFRLDLRIKMNEVGLRSVLI